MALDPLTAGLDLVGKVSDIVGRFIPDPQAKLAAQQEVFKLVVQSDLAQIATNTEEAKSDSIFVAGGRPFIIWVCGAAFAFNYVIGPFLAFGMAMAGYDTPFPHLDIAGMMPVLLGLLGLGGMRTFEKATNIQNNTTGAR